MGLLAHEEEEGHRAVVKPPRTRGHFFETRPKVGDEKYGVTVHNRFKKTGESPRQLAELLYDILRMTPDPVLVADDALPF